MAVRAPRLHSAKPLNFSRWFVSFVCSSICFYENSTKIFRWSGGYHGQPIAFVDQSVFFYAVDDGLRFHDFTNVDYPQTTTIQTNGIGVGAIVSRTIFSSSSFLDDIRIV